MAVRNFFPSIDPADPNQRWRKYGFFAALMGGVILVCLLAGLYAYGRATAVLFAAAVPCSLLLVVTAISCWLNYHVKAVLTAVLVSIYAVIWGFWLYRNRLSGNANPCACAVYVFCL